MMVCDDNDQVTPVHVSRRDALRHVGLFGWHQDAGDVDFAGLEHPDKHAADPLDQRQVEVRMLAHEGGEKAG